MLPISARQLQSSHARHTDHTHPTIYKFEKMILFPRDMNSLSVRGYCHFTDILFLLKSSTGPKMYELNT